MSEKISAIQRLVRMSESERFTTDGLQAAVTDLQDVREWAEALTTLAEAVDDLEGSIGSWADAEDRETKADARDEVQSALDAVSDAYADVSALGPMGLGVEVTP